MDLVAAPMISQSASTIFERILTSPSALVVLETTDAPELLGQFRMIADASVQSMYVWQPDTGFVSLRDRDAGVPDCRRLAASLDYLRRLPAERIRLDQRFGGSGVRPSLRDRGEAMCGARVSRGRTQGRLGVLTKALDCSIALDWMNFFQALVV